MALVIADRVRETTSSAGTGTITLTGAFSGFQSFSVIGNGNTTYYAIIDTTGSAWEVGIGTYTTLGNTLSRDTVLSSSNAGALVPFAIGLKDVICTQPSERNVYVVGSDVVAENSAKVPNSLLANSAIVFGATSQALGSTVSTLSGLTSVAATRFSGPLTGAVGDITPAAGAFTTLAASSTVTLSGGTANGVTYLNGSKVLTSGSALTFDGTNLGIGTSSPAAKLDVSPKTANTFGPNAVFGTTSTAKFRIDDLGNSAENRTFLTNNYSRSGSGFSADNSGYGVASIGLQNGIITFGTGAAGSANATDKATLDSSGNLGLGVTPSAWSVLPAIQISTYGGLSAGGGYTRLSSNAFLSTYPNTWSYINTNTATLYEQAAGTHVWKTAASGTAGAAISFTQAMTLDASGNLGVGTTSPTTKLHIANAGATYLRANNTSSTVDLYVGAQTNDATIAVISNHPLTFATNSVERARIDSSGNLIQSAPTTAPTLATNGQMVFNLTSNTNLRVSVRGSDGVTRTANLTLA